MAEMDSDTRESKDTEIHSHDPRPDVAGEATSPDKVTNGDAVAAGDLSPGDELVADAETDEDEESEEEEDEEEDEDEYEVDEMVAWSDVDEEEDEGDGDGLKPIRSKNEIKALPPVPPVVATLEPHHQLLPVGVVSSIVGAQVIVEGMEAHNPLNEDSVLWITESRQPLGMVDEIFGPVKNPFYLVRYNSESEVPACVQAGTMISFVSEFANHVLNDGNLHKKGYDASGEHDEELSDDGEFSDDEKEAEFRKNLKLSKRSWKERKSKNTEKKTDQNQDKKWKNSNPSRKQASVEQSQQPLKQNHNQRPLEGRQKNKIRTSPPVSHNDCLSSNPSGQEFGGGSGFVPQFPTMVQTTDAFPSPFGLLAGGIPTQQPQNTALPAGLPVTNFPWAALNQLQQPYQMPMLNDLAFQRFNPNQLPSSLLPGGQLNLFQRPTFPPPHDIMGVNSFNQNMFGTGLQFQAGLPNLNAMNLGAVNQGMTTNQPVAQPNFVPPPAVNPGNNQIPLTFNMGSHSHAGSNSLRGKGWRPPK